MESCEKCLQMVNNCKFLNDIADVSGARWCLLYCVKSYLGEYTCKYMYLGFDFTLIYLTTDL